MDHMDIDDVVLITHILKDKVTDDDTLKYFVRWDDGIESWINEEDMLDCDHLIQSYRQTKYTSKRKSSRRNKRMSGSARKVPPSFDFGDEVSSIIGAQMMNGELHFYVQWIGRDQGSIVSNALLRQHAPLKLVEFYESNLHIPSGQISPDGDKSYINQVGNTFANIQKPQIEPPKSDFKIFCEAFGQQYGGILEAKRAYNLLNREDKQIYIDKSKQDEKRYREALEKLSQ
eukprot:TRINITY_DN4266_c0_g1_i2.p1 TRINITY_DN4266_c0_g1~~TRINITY_DN4266_c0_g1_i2.p1  ORF type:complete len:230 (+),score=58.15 TRINITY_DN4266_c0_g1_i2:56-745(+)